MAMSIRTTMHVANAVRIGLFLILAAAGYWGINMQVKLHHELAANSASISARGPMDRAAAAPDAAVGAAVDFLEDLGMANVRRHEMEIATYAMATLTELARFHTALDGPGINHLQRLVAGWGLLADFCFADLLLFAPTVDAPDGEPWEVYTVLADVEMPAGSLRSVDPATGADAMCCASAPESASRCC